MLFYVALPIIYQMFYANNPPEAKKKKKKTDFLSLLPEKL